MMTGHPSMNVIIHAAFRRDLARFDQALAEFPAGAQPRADQLARTWDNFARQLHHHHRDEETIFFPAFRELGVDERLIHDLDTEHAAMIAALDAAQASIRSLHTDPSADNAAAARAALATLSGAVSAHLDHEERGLEPFAAQHRTAPQFKRAQAAVRNAHKGNTGTFIAWLLDSAAPNTKTALRKQIPAPALFILARLGGRNYRRKIATTWNWDTPGNSAHGNHED